ncbi:MAG: NADH-quinone oxidoreductase subunit NuoH [Candidatus Hodarchaeota archaeon]
MQAIPNIFEILAALIAFTITYLPDLIRVLVFPGFLTLTLAAYLLVWFERKFLAKIQMRVGPQYAGRFGGILQPVADFLKLFFKEHIVPEKSDKLFFRIVPIVFLALASLPIIVIPFGTSIFPIPNSTLQIWTPQVITWVIIGEGIMATYGLLIFFAISALFPMIVLIAGWASNSKYPFIGGVRSLFQQVSYEIPMWISALAVVVLSGSINLTQITASQQQIWFIFPLFLAALIFFIAIVAELERIPFDLPEAEPEIVSGWMTEYSGAPFLLIYLSFYIKMFTVSALFTSLFLGGWLPMPFVAGGMLTPPLPVLLPNFLPEPLWFLVKTGLVAIVIIFLRGVYPRTRLDQILRVAWSIWIPLSFVAVFLAVFLVAFGIFPIGGL